MIDTRPVLNEKLSWKAKGILTYLMSRPDGWEVSVADLVKRSTDGAASVRAGLKELRDAGHMRYFVSRQQGQITGWHIEVYELPLEGEFSYIFPGDKMIDGEIPPDSDFRNLDTPTGGISPDSDFQQVENQQVENRRQVLKNLSNNELKQRAPEKIEKTIEFANKKVDRILNNERLVQETSTWPGREKVPEPIRELLDVYVQLTGQKPLKGNLLDWLKEGGNWLDLGATQDDVRAAYKAAKPDNGKGFSVTRPGSLTGKIGEIVGERRANGAGANTFEKLIADAKAAKKNAEKEWVEV